MIVCAEQETKIGTVDLELTCKLDDTQLFYQNALIKYVEESATRHIAMLHIRPLAKKICVILKDLLKFRSNFELLG